MQKNKIPEISIHDYGYDLPEAKIAKFPLAERDKSKLLVYRDKLILDQLFLDIPYFLNDGLLVMNNTKVIQARMIFRKDSGSEIEVFCLEPLEPPDFITSFEQKRSCTWKCLVGNLKKWKEGPLVKEVIINGVSTHFCVTIKERKPEYQVVGFTWNNPVFTFAEIVENAGITPIPPYLKRKPEEVDVKRYQTLYSSIKGSVAAPTAGLHFTHETLNNIRHKGIETAYVTLHVGAGTFLPVKSVLVENHVMHAEYILLNHETVELLIKHIGKITAVGTTTARTLESIYWLGVKLMSGNSNEDKHFISQWDAFHLSGEFDTIDSLTAVLNYMEEKSIAYLEAFTQLMIVPGYKFKVINRLITNFHQPHSTLLLMISAFVGDEWRDIYRHALKNDYRFLSYGDAMLLESYK